MKKYELVKDDKIIVSGHTLYRLRALRDFGDVKEGDLGGYIEKESNLSHSGNCWVYDKAWVYDNAQVIDDARVCNNAEVFDHVILCDNVLVFENAQVSRNMRVGGNALVSGNADIR